MKKITKLLVLIIMLFGLGSCNLFQQNYYEDTKDITELKEEGRYQEVTFQEVKDMCKENKSFVLYLKNLSCLQCYYFQDEIAKVLKEDPNKKMYCVIFEYLTVDEIEEMKQLAYNVLGEDYYKVKEWDSDQIFVPLVFQVVKGKISNAFCGFMAAKYLRYMYILNFFDLHYLSNVEDKFKQMESFTLHMSTVGGDDENDYLDRLYEEYKNNPNKSQGYYFNLYKLDNEEKNEFIQLINDKKETEDHFSTIPSKFEIKVEQGIIIEITVLEQNEKDS